MMKHRRAKVVYSYAPQNDDELKLEVDEVIEVLDEVEEGWWKGKLRGLIGVFPSNFVVEVTPSDPPDTAKSDPNIDNDVTGERTGESTIDSSIKREETVEMEKKPKPVKGIGFGDIFAGGIKPKLSPIDNSTDKSKSNVPKKAPPPAPAIDAEPAPKLPPKPMREQAKVLFAYTAQNEDELSIKEGDTITILSKEIEDQGWWKGELNGLVGVFPDNFVELIKTPVPEESGLPQRVKKPERPVEKPPPPASSIAPQLKMKLEATKSSNKSLEELPKSMTGQTTTGPAVPGKKPKLTSSSSFTGKTTKGDQGIANSVKPDVVPQENGSKFENAITNEPEKFFNIDSSPNKLTHPTANRSKGPLRRPPSTLFKDPVIDTKENGDIINKNEVNSSNSHEQQKPPIMTQPQTPLQQQQSQEKPEKIPPWMLELRKAQAKKDKGKEPNDESPKEPTKAPLSSPTKVAANRFSGDFGNKMTVNASTPPVDSTETTPVNLLKPLKLSKPNLNAPVAVTVTSSGVTVNNTTVTVAAVTSSFSTTTTTSAAMNKVSNVSISTVTAPITKIDENATMGKEVSDLQMQLNLLKETFVTRKEYEELTKQVSELKESVESQKQSYGKVIKDLINDVAEERKKLATLQIEIDRLRKLTTTV